MSRATMLVLLVSVAAPIAHATDLDPDTEVARKHFAIGSEHYQKGRYELALKEFEASRRAKQLPALDYNIGRCLDRMERYPDAVAAYRRYVEAAPDAADVPEVRARMHELDARLAAEPALGVRLVAPPPPQPRRRWLWGVIGGAAAVAIIVLVTVGVVLGTAHNTSVETWPDVSFR